MKANRCPFCVGVCRHATGDSIAKEQQYESTAIPPHPFPAPPAPDPPSFTLHQPSQSTLLLYAVTLYVHPCFPLFQEALNLESDPLRPPPDSVLFPLLFIQSFFVADGKVWVRNYQIVDKGDGSSTALNRKIESAGNGAAGGGSGGGESATGTEDPLSLVEMGPRFVLNPIRVFAGSFGGPTLYTNAAYVSPNDVRSARKRKAGNKFEDRQDAKKIIRGKKAEPAVPRGPLDDVFSG